MQNPWNETQGPEQTGPQLAFPTLTPVVKWLLKVNFGIAVLFFVLFLVEGANGRITTALHRWLAFNPAMWSDWFPLVPVWQLVTYGFLHSVLSPGHVIWNMLQLYFFGTMLEGILGGRRFLVTYIGAMVFGALVQVVISTATGSQALVLGASGACLGIVVAMAVLRPNTRVILILIPVLLKWVAIGIVLIDMFAALRDWRLGSSDRVAHWVHLGGAAFGFVVAWRGWIWRDPVHVLAVKRAIKQEERKIADEQHVDELLERIHKEGIHSLSKRDREFLKRVSKK